MNQNFFQPLIDDIQIKQYQQDAQNCYAELKMQLNVKLFNDTETLDILDEIKRTNKKHQPVWSNLIPIYGSLKSIVNRSHQNNKKERLQKSLQKEHLFITPTDYIHVTKKDTLGYVIDAICLASSIWSVATITTAIIKTGFSTTLRSLFSTNFYKRINLSALGEKHHIISQQWFKNNPSILTDWFMNSYANIIVLPQHLHRGVGFFNFWHKNPLGMTLLMSFKNINTIKWLNNIIMSNNINTTLTTENCHDLLILAALKELSDEHYYHAEIHKTIDKLTI